jgi:uncharacterized protein
MKCPACFNELTEAHVGGLIVDVCQDGCAGIWFDAFELEQAGEEPEPAAEGLLHIRRDERLVVDPSRKRECPRCPGIKLHRHFFSAKRRVEVDQCPNCAGYWLDAGELALVRSEQAQSSAAVSAQQSNLSSEVIRYIYRLRTERRRP